MQPLPIIPYRVGVLPPSWLEADDQGLPQPLSASRTRRRWCRGTLKCNGEARLAVQASVNSCVSISLRHCTVLHRASLDLVGVSFPLTTMMFGGALSNLAGTSCPGSEAVTRCWWSTYTIMPR
ncbi:hypothetical protein BAUCODRAFT_378429 [Baudoinia panamericana UAMH 10762]|uniref:Uncharacterized protein n=1 Tax=Baudoinia panamericana (strain UAMH 10762) TaxID=717646 RepID=M2NH95_BAUPA|nr:uncharacterized protein BAUCODRAFT_378429 [Baudoinia panamericana UAMH 10762]EMC98709.1 hypothetical protein BAUCODRAFT_378429 [Baudoinia panamericana UAMH 10762]